MFKKKGNKGKNGKKVEEVKGLKKPEKKQPATFEDFYAAKKKQMADWKIWTFGQASAKGYTEVADVNIVPDNATKSNADKIREVVAYFEKPSKKSK